MTVLDGYLSGRTMFLSPRYVLVLVLILNVLLVSRVDGQPACFIKLSKIHNLCNSQYHKNVERQKNSPSQCPSLLQLFRCLETGRRYLRQCSEKVRKDYDANIAEGKEEARTDLMCGARSSLGDRRTLSVFFPFLACFFSSFTSSLLRWYDYNNCARALRFVRWHFKAYLRLLNYTTGWLSLYRQMFLKSYLI